MGLADSYHVGMLGVHFNPSLNPDNTAVLRVGTEPASVSRYKSLMLTSRRSCLSLSRSSPRVPSTSSQPPRDPWTTGCPATPTTPGSSGGTPSSSKLGGQPTASEPEMEIIGRNSQSDKRNITVITRVDNVLDAAILLQQKRKLDFHFSITGLWKRNKIKTNPSHRL